MKRRSTAALLGTALLAGSALVTGAGAADASDPATSPVCAPGARYPSPLPSATVAATKLRGGYSFLEGPVWVADGGYLLASNLGPATGPEQVQPSSILRFTPAGAVDTFVADAGSNGLALTPDAGQLVAATHDRRSVSTYRLADRSRGVVAADYQGRTFNSPNDVTVRADGTVYFTDPDFQRGRRADQMRGRTGVFRVSGGQVSLVDDTVREPNGVALSPDGSTLYVGAYAENRIYAYPVQANGSTGARRVFAGIAGPDGVTVDCAGNVYWASHTDGLVHVFSAGGTPLGAVSSGSGTTNVAFGGPDRQTLYVTSGPQGDSGLYGVHLQVPGWPY
jgi:gluconolactonase